MKMVSAAKMRGDANRLAQATPFGKWVDELGAKSQDIEFIDTSVYPKTNLFVAFTTDKGLCGGVNSFISRGMRKVGAKMAAEGKSLQLVVSRASPAKVSCCPGMTGPVVFNWIHTWVPERSWG